MVHSGPFNGLCEIESSRGSPGISNIFLPMLQLLRITPSLTPLLISSYLLPQFLPLLSYVTIRRKQRTLIDSHRHEPLPESQNFLWKMRSGCERISVTKKAQMDALRRYLNFSPTYYIINIFLT